MPFGSSLNEIVQRHEALRTNFTVHDERPVQRIAPERELRARGGRSAGALAGEREAVVRQRVEEEARTPFDLGRDLLIRAALLRLEETESVFLLTMHHVVSDGWSLGVFGRELATLYTAFTRGEPSPLPPLPIQYADYAVWQRRWLQGPEMEEQLSYWQEQFHGELPTLDLPTDHPRPAQPTHRGAQRAVTLPAPLVEALGELGRQHGATLFATLLAAFNALLYRYTGQDDLVVGTPIAGRRRAELEGLIGFFLNTLALRTDLTGNPSFEELLGRVRRTTTAAYSNQDVPFERLVEALALERDLSRTPLFQVMFVLQNFPMGPVELPGLHLEPLEGVHLTAKMDLHVHLYEVEEGLRCTFDYSTDLFEAETIERMLGHYQQLLELVVADPTQPLKRLALGLGAEPSPSLAAVPEAALFERFGADAVEQSLAPGLRGASRTVAAAGGPPHAPAHLELRAAQRRGESDRSPPLGTLRAGARAGGVALRARGTDGGGRARRAEGGQDLRPARSALSPRPLTVHPGRCGGRGASDRRVGMWRWERTSARWRRPTRWSLTSIQGYDSAVTTNPGLAIDPERPAYILYTSGSTGRPKGVVQSHRNVLHHIRVYTNNLKIC